MEQFKNKGEFLSQEIDINRLTPIQWTGILRAMDKYTIYYYNLLGGSDSREINGTDSREFSDIPCCICGQRLTVKENESCSIYNPTERICDKCLIISKNICPVCDGEGQTYGVMGFSKCKTCNTGKKHDSEKWWEHLTTSTKQKLINNYHYGKTPDTISEYEIFRMWSDESFIDLIDNVIPAESTQESVKKSWGNNITGYIKNIRSK